MNKISWGIIGCGDVTELKSGPAFNLVPNSELSAVMRRDGIKAKDYAKRHGVRKWYNDASELLQDSTINAIYIATPPAYHEAYALQAFKAGKNVYVEKPMALDSMEAERMNKAAIEYSCKLSIAHYRRAQPKFRRIAHLIKDGTIGKIQSAELKFKQAYQPGTEHTWRTDPSISGGGLFHDLAPHQLDLMFFFFGVPLKTSGTSLNKAKLYAADDYVDADILFNDNIKFSGVWDFNAQKDDETDFCEINGADGKIRFSVFGSPCELILDGITEQLEFDHLPHVQQPMIEQVIKYFRNEAINPCSAADGVEVMRMMDEITGKL